MTETIEQSAEPIGIFSEKISRLARNLIDEGVIKHTFISGEI